MEQTVELYRVRKLLPPLTFDINLKTLITCSVDILKLLKTFYVICFPENAVNFTRNRIVRLEGICHLLFLLILIYFLFTTS